MTVRPARAVQSTRANRDWLPDYDVTLPLVRGLIDRQIPQLRGASVELLDVGWDDAVYAVRGADGRDWGFRFPRRRLGVLAMQREIAVLGALAAELPLPVPAPAFVGAPSPRHPRPFWGAPLLPGAELARAGVPVGDRVGIGAALGGFLRALHEPNTIDVLRASTADVALLTRIDINRRALPGSVADRARLRLDSIGLRGRARAIADGVLSAADALPQAPLDSGSAGLALVHGDLHLRHLLVSADGGPAVITGVIDWGDACLSDPAIDLSIAYAAFEGPSRAALFGAYGRPLSAEGEALARTVALFLSAALADQAIDTGDEALEAEARAGIARAVGD
jgi:aminoglycoside phosphotransferase (APT) family kinase protein